MQSVLVRYSKGQMKIQEMAFVLIALSVFFALIIIFYVSIRSSSLQNEFSSSEDEKARSIVKRLGDSGELAWRHCDGCIDLDKALVLKERVNKNWAGLDCLKIELVGSGKKNECTKANYPDCGYITLINNNGCKTPSWTYSALCRYENDKGGYDKCSLGRIYASQN